MTYITAPGYRQQVDDALMERESPNAQLVQQPRQASLTYHRGGCVRLESG